MVLERLQNRFRVVLDGFRPAPEVKPLVVSVFQSAV